MNTVRPRRLIPSLGVVTFLASCEAPAPEAATFPNETRSEPTTPAIAASEATSTASEATPPAATANSPVVSPLMPPKPKSRPRLTNTEKVSFEFRETPVGDAIRLIADRAGANFIFPENLAGSISASLKDVTLDQALEVVVNSGSLEVVEHAGVIAVRATAAQKTETRIYQPKTSSALTLEPQVKALLGEGATLTVDSDANLLLVTGGEEQLAKVDQWMAALDAASPKDVLIEARIVEVSLNENFEFGVGIALDDISIADTTTHLLSSFARASDSFQITTLDPTSDLSAVLRALQSYGRLHVIASPRVMALNQNEAKIEITEKIPYIDATATTSGSTSGITTSSVEEVEFEVVGIRLHVTPTVGANGDITLKIHQEVSEVVDFFESVPVTDNRLIETRFVTGDRQTIVIGGLLKERTRKHDDGIPWLMDIPLLGWLFSGTDTTKEKVELLVFITPRIVGSDDIDDVSSEYKRELIRKNFEYRQEQYQEFLDDVK